jgi:hypothetical protein
MGCIPALQAPFGRRLVAFALLAVACAPRLGGAQVGAAATRSATDAAPAVPAVGAAAPLTGPSATLGQTVRHALRATVGVLARAETSAWQLDPAGAVWQQTVITRANVPVVVWLSTSADTPPAGLAGWQVRTPNGWRSWRGEPVAVSAVLAAGAASVPVHLRRPGGASGDAPTELATTRVSLRPATP